DDDAVYFATRYGVYRLSKSDHVITALIQPLPIDSKGVHALVNHLMVDGQRLYVDLGLSWLTSPAGKLVAMDATGGPTVDLLEMRLADPGIVGMSANRSLVYLLSQGALRQIAPTGGIDLLATNSSPETFDLLVAGSSRLYFTDSKCDKNGSCNTTVHSIL